MDLRSIQGAFRSIVTYEEVAPGDVSWRQPVCDNSKWSPNALGSSGDALGSSGHALRTPWKALGTLCGPLGTLWGALGKLWGSSGEPLGKLWEALGKLWEALGTLWGRFGDDLGNTGDKETKREQPRRDTESILKHQKICPPKLPITRLWRPYW